MSDPIDLGARRASPSEARPPGSLLAEEECLMPSHVAMTIAAALHQHQTDKAGRPYREHLHQVVDGVRVLGGDEHDTVAAWLHDAVEDGLAAYEVLAALGASQTSLDTIRAVTKIKGETNHDSLDRVVAAGPRAQRLKLADLLSNTRHDRVAALRTMAGDDEAALAKIDNRIRVYQRWIQTIMVELGLLNPYVGHG